MRILIALLLSAGLATAASTNVFDVVTATSFSGSAASLTGANASTLFSSGTAQGIYLGNTNGVVSTTAIHALVMQGTNQTLVFTNITRMLDSQTVSNMTLVNLTVTTNASSGNIALTATGSVFIATAMPNNSNTRTNFRVASTNLVAFEVLTSDSGSAIFTTWGGYFGSYGGNNGFKMLGRSDRSRQVEFLAGDNTTMGYVGSDGTLRVLGSDIWSSGNSVSSLGMNARWTAVSGLTINTNVGIAGSVTVTNAGGGTNLFLGKNWSTNNVAPFIWSANPTNAYVVDTLYTNAAQRGGLQGGIVLNAAATGTAQIDLLYTNNSIGYRMTWMNPALSGFSSMNGFGGVRLDPSATFKFVSTMGTGATGYITNVVLFNE